MTTPQQLLQEYLDGIEAMKPNTFGKDLKEVKRQADIFRTAIQQLNNLFNTKQINPKKYITSKKEIIKLNKKKQLRPAKRNGSKWKVNI